MPPEQNGFPSTAIGLRRRLTSQPHHEILEYRMLSSWLMIVSWLVNVTDFRSSTATCPAVVRWLELQEAFHTGATHRERSDTSHQTWEAVATLRSTVVGEPAAGWSSSQKATSLGRTGMNLRAHRKCDLD